MKEKKYCIYKHTNLLNGKIYIGQTCNVEQRFSCNGQRYKDCPYFYSAIQKYGWENFSHEILIDNLSLQEANQKEIEYIQLYSTTNPDKGYNISTGGGGSAGIPSSEEKKEKIKTTLQKRTDLGNIKILCVNTGEVFHSVRAAARAYGIGSSSHLKEAADGKREYYGKHPETKEKLYWKTIKEDYDYA